MIKRIGIFCPPGRGHLYPLTSLGRSLSDRGYNVTVFNRHIAQAIVQQSGLCFVPLEARPTPSIWPDDDRLIGPNSLNILYAHADLVLQSAGNALKQSRVQALLVDQSDFAAGSVADFLGIPFLNLSVMLPVFLCDERPPSIVGWLPRSSFDDRRRNRRGNFLLEQLVAPIVARVNAQRAIWNLNPIDDLNALFSKKAIIAQLPQALDFPLAGCPPHLFHTGRFCRGGDWRIPDFPWSRLNGKPIVYASMGTVRCGFRQVFEMIAAATSQFDVQLVMSLGGMKLTPNEFRNLPGDPIVVHYAPQAELLARARLCITHGGLNTVLDAVGSGVPLIAFPVTDDHLGIAARIKWHGIGESLPFRRLSPDRLKEVLGRVLSDETYLGAAKTMEQIITKIDGLDLATTMVEKSLSKC